MTKSKKLISMLLAFVMLITSCSLSFFAFAADSDVEEANSLAETAITGMNANTVQTADTNLLNKLNSLSASERLRVNPTYYAYAVHVAANQIIRSENGNKNPTAAQRQAKYDGIAASNDVILAQFDAVLKIPDEYIKVIKDIHDVNESIKTDSVLTSATIKMVYDNNFNNLNFGTNETAKLMFEAFWDSYKNYSDEQLLFAEILVLANANNVTNAFGTTQKNHILNDSVTFGDTTFSYYFGDRTAKRLALLYYVYSAEPVNVNVVKAKYIASNKWIDSENGPTEYYNELKEFYTNGNAKTKKFFVDYLTALSDASDDFAGLEKLGKTIDVGLDLLDGKDVAFADIKEAYNAYNDLTDTGKYIIDLFDKNFTTSPAPLFNPEISNLTAKENIKFGDDDAAASIEYLAANPSTMSNAAGYNGIKLQALINAVADAYAEQLPIEEYTELVNNTIAKQPNITQDDVDAVWDAFNNLKEEHQNIVKNTSELWENTQTIMTSQFVNYVNAVDMNNVTDANRTESTKLLNDTDENFKPLIVPGDDQIYKSEYNKYLQIQIDDFRKYVEGVDLNNITAENRTVAEQKYNALTDEFKAAVQDDADLYNTYLVILASEFKDYVKSIDLDKVDDSVRKEARERYLALSDAAKENAYSDPETWNKYTQIQAPDVDTNKHSEEAAKKADKVTYPNSDSEAIKALGKEKSIDNVENFIIDDLLPTLTDQIVIEDKNDVVNSALKQHLSNETIGKIYGLYATLSHNKSEIAPGMKAGDVVQSVIPVEGFVARLYEDDFAAAKGKIYNVIASGKIPTDKDGNPVKVPCGTNDDGTTNYEDANMYDAIAAIEFKNGDFGFNDGDRDGFEKALLAVLRPITGLCYPDNPFGIEFFNHADKATGEYTFGVYECCVKLLEVLGVKNLPTDAEYKANYLTVFAQTYATAPESSDYEKQIRATSIAGDELLKPVIDGVFSLIDDEFNTLTDILILLPRLGDLVQSDIPSIAYSNLVRDLGMLSGLVTDIEIEGMKLDTLVNKNVLAPALLKLINDKLAGLGINLAMPDWNALNKYTTFKVNKSAQYDKDYVAVRYIGGDDMFTEAVYYLYDNLFANKANADALKEKIGGFPLVGSNLSALIEKGEKAGKMKTYAAILDYFYDNGDNKDATADAGKSIGDAIKSLNNTLNLNKIDASKAKIKLSKRKYAYNGKIQKPSVKVTLNGEVLKKGVAYKVKYSKDNSKKIGAYKVTVVFIGAYEGKNKTAKYTIGPKNARKIKLVSKKGALKVKYKKSKSTSVKGYYIEYSTSKAFKNSKKVKVEGRSTTSKTISGLKSGKKYYVRIKSYTVKSGKKIYSPFSNPKAVKVK